MKYRLLLFLAFIFTQNHAIGFPIQSIQLKLPPTLTLPSYWMILLIIFILLITMPFLYIRYLLNLYIPESKKVYFFEGTYNVNQIIKHLEDLEKTFHKKFPKFKKSIEKYDQEATGDLKKHAEVIDSILFCIKLNGRKRLKVFWEFSDPFLKILIVSLPAIGVIFVLISEYYYGVVGLTFSLFSLIFLLPLMLIIFNSILQFAQYILRKTNKTSPALNISLFTLEVILNRKVIRSLDEKSGNYYYYTTIHNYNNLVNEKQVFSNVYIRTSSSFYGDLNEHSLGE